MITASEKNVSLSRVLSLIRLHRNKHKLMRAVPHCYICTVALIALQLAAARMSYAGSATWSLNPPSGNWNGGGNWTPGTVPNSASDTATFGASNRTSVSLSQNTTVADIVFNAGANAFVISVPGMLALNLGGSGISNNSSNAESFSTAGGAQFMLPGATINFSNSASAGSANFTNFGATGLFAAGGRTIFRNSATAANGNFTNKGVAAVIASYGGRTLFFDNSTAGNGTFLNEIPTGNDGSGGSIEFWDNSSAGNALFFNIGSVNGHIGGYMGFGHTSSAGTATFINHAGGANGAVGGSVGISGNSNGGSAHFVNEAGPGMAFGKTDVADSANAGTALFTNNGGEAGAEVGGHTLIAFRATAGNATFDNNGGSADGAFGGSTTFRYDSKGHPTAANGTFNNYGGVVSGAHGGFTEFYETATGANGTFNNNGGSVAGAGGGSAIFYDSSTAGDGTFNNNGGSVADADGGSTNFYDSSTAGSSTLIANSAVGLSSSITFADNSTGGTSRAKVFGNGYLAIDQHAFATVPIGSIEGDGTVYTGANNLSIGTNNLATSFSGSIGDGGAGGGFAKTGSGVLTFENRADNNYLSDTLTLSIASGSTINLNFSGTPDTVRSLIIGGVPQMPGLYGSVASGAPNQCAQFAGTGKILVTTFAVSRKMQGASSYDINLPLGGPVGVECRVGENYQIVATFVNAVSFASASVTSGSGSVSGASGNNSSTVTIGLAGVTSPQRIAVTISGVNDGFTTNDLVIPIGVLVGDTSGNGIVNATDVSQTKAQSGQPVSASNFREDVSASGSINATDVSVVKLQSGTGLPAILNRPSNNRDGFLQERQD